MDFTMLVPALDGQENVLVQTNVLTKFTMAVPTHSEWVTTVVNSLIKEWFLVYQLPEQGKWFEAECPGVLQGVWGTQVQGDALPPLLHLT